MPYAENPWHGSQGWKLSLVLIFLSNSLMKVYLSKYITGIKTIRHVRLSFPQDLYKEMVKAHGPKIAEEICES